MPPENPNVVQELDSLADPVGLAAILLAKSGNPADRQMLLDLAQLRPRSWGVWMAMAHAGTIDFPRAGLARPVYQDQKVPVAVRVAAASALEALDSQAGAFAVGQIQAFMVRFADQGADLYGSIRRSRSGSNRCIGTGGETWRRRTPTLQFRDMRLNFHMLGALLVLKKMGPNSSLSNT